MPTPAAAVEAIKQAISQGAVAHPRADRLTGFSGRQLIGAMQRLMGLFEKDPSACYLEIGVFQGLSLLSVAVANPSVPCYGIDNFSQFDPDGTNLRIVNARMQTMGVTNAHVINKDYEAAFECLAGDIEHRKVAVYFVDGPHDYRSQLMCLELALPYLHPEALIIVDDSNYRHVRQANCDFLVTHPRFRLIFEAYTPCHPNDMSAAERAATEAGWWNGVNVIVANAPEDARRQLPPIEESKLLFVNDHLVHAHRMASFARDALDLVDAMYVRSPRLFLRRLLNMRRTINAQATTIGCYHTTNTYSDSLPRMRFNIAEKQATSAEDGLSA